MIRNTSEISELSELRADYLAALANAQAKALQYNLLRYQLVRSWFTKFFTLSDAVNVYNKLTTSTDERMKYDRNKKGFMFVSVRYNDSNLIDFEAYLVHASEPRHKMVYDLTKEHPLNLKKQNTYLEWGSSLTMLIPLDDLSEDMAKLVRPSNVGYWIKLEQAIDVSQLYHNSGMGDWLGIFNGFERNLNCTLTKSVI